MIARLISWSARNLVLVLVGTVFAVATGVLALRTLPLDAIPDLSDVQAIVYTEYPYPPPHSWAWAVVAAAPPRAAVGSAKGSKEGRRRGARANR